MERELDLAAAEINIRFSEAYDQAPPLPRPLKSRRFEFSYITSDGLFRESTMVAPLDEGELEHLTQW